MKPADCILFSGGARGAEAEFGACAEQHGIEEVNFTFDGHNDVRRRGVRVLNHEELQSGDVSLEYVSKLMNRRYSQGVIIRKVLQTLWYRSIPARRSTSSERSSPTAPFAADRLGRRVRETVQQTVHVFDQDKNAWFTWSGSEWRAVRPNDKLVITHPHFTGTGTRTLQDNAKRAIADLYSDRFRGSRTRQDEPTIANIPTIGNIGPEGDANGGSSASWV